MIKVKFFTLGCKVNQYETQALKERFEEYGILPTEDKADIYVINTCSVTYRADVKSKEAVIKAKRENPQAKIVVCGCGVQLKNPLLEKLGIDCVVPQQEKGRAVEIVLGRPFKKVTVEDLKIREFPYCRAFIKIQDGCDNFCSFCKIPYLRGPSRSRTLIEIEEEVKRLSPKHREIVLCGVNIGLYGRDLKPQARLSDLIYQLLKIKELGRIRLSSLEPYLIDDALLSLFKNPRVCPHLHLPFQSGDNDILRKMNKKESVDDYYRIVDKARDLFPDIAISCDIIVGFPSEQEENFQNTLKFLKRIKPMRIHIFPFSPRQNTVFENFKLRNFNEVKYRQHILKQLKEQFAEEYYYRFLSKELNAIVEERNEGYVQGYTQNYIKVSIPQNLSLGNIYKVKVYKIDKGKVFAFKH